MALSNSDVNKVIQNAQLNLKSQLNPKQMSVPYYLQIRQRSIKHMQVVQFAHNAQTLRQGNALYTLWNPLHNRIQQTYITWKILNKT